MYPQKTKCLKWQKISLVALCVLLLLTITSSALYVSNEDADYYVPLIDFQCSINRGVFDLTPSVYAHENTLATETAYGESTIVRSTIKRNNWGFYDPSTPTLNAHWRDVSYRLGLDMYLDTDDFDMIVSADVGTFNFTSYEIPAVLVPNGYDATIEVEYNMYYADGQAHEYQSYPIVYTQNYRQNDVIELLRPYTIELGVHHDILGNVIICDYNATIHFEKQAPSLGYSGYYVFHGVLGSLPDSAIEDLYVDGDTWLNCKPDASIRIFGTGGDGSTVDREVGAIYFQSDASDVSMWYDLIENMDTIMVYDMTNDEWLLAEAGDLYDPSSPDYITFTEIQVRQLYLEQDIEDTFYMESNDDIDLVNWFVSNTTYSSESQVLNTPTTYGFTSDDGGIYVRYVVLPSARNSVRPYLSGLWNSAYNRGYASGNNPEVNVDFVSWALSAIGDALTVQIFPGFSIGGLLAVIIAIPLCIIFLKLFAGG